MMFPDIVNLDYEIAKGAMAPFLFMRQQKLGGSH
jgi:hypothetical protein